MNFVNFIHNDHWLALVHYNETYDFYIYQNCFAYVATVEVGDEIYRQINGGNTELQDNLTESISEALNKLGIFDVNYTKFEEMMNDMLEIFKTLFPQTLKK